MKRRRLLAILSRYLWPIDSGRKESLNRYFRELYDNYDFEIKILCFLEKGQKVVDADRPYYISSVTSLEDVSKTEAISNIFHYSLSTQGWPYQCSLHYSENNKKIISKYVNEWRPDVVFTEMIRTCMYYDLFERTGAVLIANLDDLLSKRYLRQARSEYKNSDFVGIYGAKVPKLISKIINANFIRRRILLSEADKCRKWEDKLYRIYDYIFLTSNVECEEFNVRMAADKAKTLSVGIDYEYLSESAAVAKDTAGISYLGNFKVAANVDTLEMIIDDILPKVSRPWKFYVIGNCPAEIKRRYERESIVFCGRVDDIREYIKKTVVFLAPIAYGTGVKTKIVEAMAMGVPVVTNSIGAEGIFADNGTDYIVSDDADSIARAVDLLLSDNDLANRMGENAKEFAYKNFRWEKVLKVFEEVFN